MATIITDDCIDTDQLSPGTGRRYRIDDASIECESGGSDGAYDLLHVRSHDADEIGRRIADNLRDAGLTNTEDGESLFLTVRIRIDRRPQQRIAHCCRECGEEVGGEDGYCTAHPKAIVDSIVIGGAS